MAVIGHLPVVSEILLTSDFLFDICSIDTLENLTGGGYADRLIFPSLKIIRK